MRFGKSLGFSVVELLVAVALLATIITLTIPAFGSILGRAKLDNQMWRFEQDFENARQLAVKWTNSVAICPSRSGTSCDLNSHSWQYGYIVFIDADDDGIYSPVTDSLLTANKIDNASLEIVYGSTKLVFGPSGKVLNGDGTMEFVALLSADQYARGSISIAKSGQISLIKNVQQ